MEAVEEGNGCDEVRRRPFRPLTPLLLKAPVLASVTVETEKPCSR